MGRTGRCPLFRGICDHGVLIGMCPNRPTCTMLRDIEAKDGHLLSVFREGR